MDSKRILIATRVGDPHALVVAQALRDQGHEPILWYGADFPSQARITMEPDPGASLRLQMDGPETGLDGNDVDSVWFRRPSKPAVQPLPQQADVTFSQNEAEEFSRAFWTACGPNARWVNPFTAHRAANDKPTQLKIAYGLGIKAPRTLFSNDPARIRGFIQAISGGVVYKTYHQTYWQGEGYSASVFTSQIREDDLPSDTLLQACPGIYQEKIEKAYELRITVMGNAVIAVRLDSQSTAGAILDWRAATQAIPMTPFELPVQISEACQAMLRALNLAFACMDWIVTPDGDYYFLELNEQGQFLWIEEACPRVPMLQLFSDLLVHGAVEQRIDARPGDVAFEDYLALSSELLQHERALHVATESGAIPEQGPPLSASLQLA